MPENVVGRIKELSGRPDPVLFERARVGPAGALYITREDRLYIRSLCSAASVVLAVRARIQQPDGEVTPIAQTHTPNSDRSAALSVFDLADGFLRSVHVAVASGTVKHGRCYVEIGLLRGINTYSAALEVLAQDYVSQTEGLGYPFGRIKSSTDGPGAPRTIVGTDPDPGSEASEAVPTNALWHIKTFFGIFTTDATVANRRVHIVLDDGTNRFWDSWGPANQIASEVETVVGATGQNLRANSNSISNICLPLDILLPAGHQISTAVNNLKAGDDWSAPVLHVTEWLEE